MHVCHAETECHAENVRHAELVSASKRNPNMKQGYVYILSYKNRTTLYIGVTNDLVRRVLEHKTGQGSIFTTKYQLTNLVYYDQILGMKNAINREKQLKNWHREWKWNLIKELNPNLEDLGKDWIEE